MATKKRKKPSLATTWLSVTDVREAITRSRNTHAKLTKRLAHLEGEVEHARTNAADVLADFSQDERAKALKRMVGTKQAELSATPPTSGTRSCATSRPSATGSRQRAPTTGRPFKC